MQMVKVIGSTSAQGDTFKIKDTKIVLTVLQFDSKLQAKHLSHIQI
jgi:serine/threonine-protein kinase